MSDDELPRDPWGGDDEHPSGILDRARTIRLALLDLPDLSAVFAAISALSDEECRLIALEAAMDSWFVRHYGNR